MKRFTLALALAALALAACSPIAKVVPTAGPPPAAATPTKPPLLPTPQPSATSAPAVQPPVIEAEPGGRLITAQNAAGLQGRALALPAQPWKLLWPAPDRLRVLMQPDAPAAARTAEFDLGALSNSPVEGVYAVPENFLDISADGGLTAYVDEAGQVKLAGANGEAVLLPVQGTVYGGFFSDDGRRFVTTAAEKWEATVWDAATGKKLAVLDDFETAAPVYGAYMGYGNTLMWQVRGTAQIDDIESGQTRFTLSYMDFITGWDFAPDGQSLGLAVEGKVRVVDLFSEEERWAADAPGMYTLVYSPDSRLIAAGGSLGIGVWDAASGAQVAFLPADVYAISFSPDGTALAGLLNAGGVEVWK